MSCRANMTGISETPMTDVLIIGAGLAGTAAALWLGDHGHDTTLVEARPRIGGRALSRPWGAGDPVEFGGGWLRADHARMIALAARLGVPLIPRAPAITGQRWFQDGKPLPAPSPDMATHAGGMARLRADAALMARGGEEATQLSTLTAAAYLDDCRMPPSVRREFLAWWAISGSGDPARIGVTELLTPKLAGGLQVKLDELALTVQGGASRLVEAAARESRAALLTGDPVERLEDCPDGVQAILASGRVLSARAALVTAPLNTLSQIRFTPPLAPPQAALRAAGHQGQAIKLLIRARGVPPGLLATGETAGLRWLYADHLRPDGSTLIVAFGLFAETGEPTEAAIRSALAAAFPEARFEGFDWHDWVNDPFARGTWVSPALATLPLYDPANWTAHPRIAFAGSDHASAEQGWFEGALLSAEAAVASLHRHLTQGFPTP